MTKKTCSFFISIAVIIYLLIGVSFYASDVRYSRSAINICPAGVVGEEQMANCSPQDISLKTDWATAATLTVGWLPLLTYFAGFQ